MNAPATQQRQTFALPWPFVVGGLLVGLHLVVALLSLVWTPYGVGDMVGGRLEGPSLIHLAGTDRLGRDLMTQIMIGSRIAVIVGCGAVALGALIGVTIGVLAAFATHTLDDVLAAGCDTLVTADLKYNHFEEAKYRGLNLIDAGHFETENPVCAVLERVVREALPELTVLRAKAHKDETQFL